MIITPGRDIIAPASLITAPGAVGLEAWFKLENVHPRTGRVTPLTDWFRNVMLEGAGTVDGYGMKVMGWRGDWFNYVQVGSDSTDPDTNQSGLISWKAGTNTLHPTPSIATTFGASSSAPYYGWKQKVFRFSPGQVPAGSGLNEVCIAYGVGAGTATNRARIVDSDGNYTTPTPASDEYLDVTVQVRCYAATTTATGSVTFGTDTFDYEVRAASANSGVSWGERIGQQMGGYASSYASWSAWSGYIGEIWETPSGSSVSADNSAPVTLTYLNNKEIDIIFTVGTQGWNVGGDGIKALTFLTTHGAFQCGFSRTAPVADGKGIQKTDAKLMGVRYKLLWDLGPAS
jgi:hypothetical protein